MGKTKFAELVKLEELNNTDLLECIKHEIDLDPKTSRSLILRYIFSTDRQREIYLMNYTVAYLYFGKRWNQYKIAEHLGINQSNVNTRITRMKKQFSKLVKKSCVSR